MFDINFETEDDTKYELTIVAVYFDDPDDRGMELYIEEINPTPLGFHFREIFDAWNYHSEIYDNAADRAYLELGEV